MASSGGVKGDMKGFFKQRKQGRGISKQKAAKKSSPKQSATVGSDVVHPPALISHGSLDLTDEYIEKEEVLRQFDMNMAYGPCLGMSRMARWERAHKLGLNPPKDVESILNLRQARVDCLWDGRV